MIIIIMIIIIMIIMIIMIIVIYNYIIPHLHVSESACSMAVLVIIMSNIPQYLSISHSLLR